MTLQGSIDRDLTALAHSTAKLLNVPFVIISIDGSEPTKSSVDAGSNIKALYVDHDWANAHPELNVEEFDSPSAAVLKDLPFFASLPIRTATGATVGLLSCGGSEERTLSDAELSLLKNAAAQIAARATSPAEIPVVARA